MQGRSRSIGMVGLVVIVALGVGPSRATAADAPGAEAIVVSAVSADGGRRVVATASGAVWTFAAEQRGWCELGTVCADGHVARALPASAVVDVRFSPFDPSVVYVAAGDDGHGPSRAGVYVSDDFGKSWHRVTRLHCDGATAAPEAVGVSNQRAGSVWAIGACEVARSDDGGVTWSHQPIAVARRGPSPKAPTAAIQLASPAGAPEDSR